MLDIPLGFYQTGSEYLRRCPILFVCVTPALNCTRRYYPQGVSLIFYRYFQLINVLRVYWLSRRQQFSWIPVSAAAASVVLPTCIILVLPFLSCRWYDLSVVHILFKFGIILVQEMGFTPFLGGSSHHKTAWGVFDVYQRFFVSSTRGVLSRFFLFFFLDASGSSLSLAWVYHSLFQSYWTFYPQFLHAIWSKFILGICYFSFLPPLSSPVFPCCANMSWFLTTLDW